MSAILFGWVITLTWFILPCLGTRTLDLNGKWTVSSAKKGISVSGNVPGSMYTALMDNKVIGDPYFRKNDKEYKWIGEEDWTFNRTFSVSAEVLAYPAVMLVCEGLDTVATVIINGKIVGNSDNMFVRYVFDIKPALVVGQNNITVTFTSAVRYGRAQAQAYPYLVLPGFTSPTQHGQNHVNMIGENTITIQFRSATQYVQEVAQSLSYAIFPNCIIPEYHGPCGANLIRKMQCSFSWDWGPSFPTQGIWRDIYIQGYSTAVISEVTTETTKNSDGTWQLKVDVFTEVVSGPDVHGTLQVRLGDTTVAMSKEVTLNYQNNKVTFDIPISTSVGIGEWWPNGYGKQTLYDLYVFYSDNMGTMNTKKISIGFRTVELVQDYVSVNKSQGRTFYFRINGRPIFLKGSNWIPADSFLERITEDRVYNYLKSAADAHMNAMRVWGGGIYEFDMFYETADKLGIMIWQDFMFACSMYPTNTAYLNSVKQEVTYQVRRMKHHPSIIVLSGNNENEKALVQDWYGTDVNFTRYKEDYLKLYIDTIRTTVLQEDTSRPFISSSPSNGLETEMEGWVAKQPWDTHYGDIHEYMYLVPFYDPSQFRVPRMSSEYGLQSFPSLETLTPVYNETDMDYWSDLNDYRNHHPFGNVEMMAEAIQYVKLPNCPDRKQRFSDLIYVTQIVHAVGMKTETENYRRWQNRLDNEGQGNTMGAMYWMLADIWQAPTWASLEYGGKWKMLHYYATNFFAPTLISPFMDGDELDVYVVLDELPAIEMRHSGQHTLQFKPKSNPRPFSLFDLETWSGPPEAGSSSNTVVDAVDDFSGNLYIEIYSWDNMLPLKTWKIPFKVNTTAESVFRRNVDEMVTESGCLRRSACVLNFHFGDFVNGPTNWLPLSTLNVVSEPMQRLQKANIRITSVKATSTQNTFSISLTTNNIAPFVWLEAMGIRGRFSDNGFVMFNNTKILNFYSWEQTTATELTDALTVKSLMDVYY